LHHAGPEIEVVILEGVELEIECPVGSRNSIRVIPFKIFRDTIPDVHGLEIWVISIVEGSSIGVEFIGKLYNQHMSNYQSPQTYHKLQSRPVIRFLAVRGFRCIRIDKSSSLIFEQRQLVGQTIGIA
jgi:hypothetical protein